jgi:hypothetical protein
MLTSGVMRSTTPLELTEPGDIYSDYVRAPYQPLASTDGKLRAVNLLYRSFALAGEEARGARLVTALRDALGGGATVWSIKHQEGALGWELYFYNPGRVFPAIELRTVREALQGLIRIDVEIPSHVDWHMFSIELGPAELAGAPVDTVHLYVNGAQRKGSSRSYARRRDEVLLENLYTFHDPLVDADEIVGRLRSSVHLDRDPISAALWPELFRCRRICVSNKPRSDGMYFAGVDVGQLSHLLRACGWPRALESFVNEESARLDHLMFDVGFDFSRGADGRTVIRKSACYATF